MRDGECGDKQSNGDGSGASLAGAKIASGGPILLVLFGVGTLCGSVLGGRFADMNLMRTLWVGMVVLGVSLAAFSVTAHNKVLMTATLIVFGVAGFLINPGLQTRVLNEAKGAATLASAGNISAFNIGNAVGPWAAGLAISAGHGYLSPSWVAMAFAGCALITALAGSAVDAGERRRSPVADRTRPRGTRDGGRGRDRRRTPAGRHHHRRAVLPVRSTR
ncbi:MFS transporter [Streptomyces vastus]|uniref:MFS transporter n=1 Tax=Streptomyces vastus TaxID=285451 RepID=A0ABN3Q9Q2_9ACTN